MGLKPSLEEFHGVEFTKEAITAAVQLSQKHINDRFLPGESRAIDLLDVIEGDYGRERLIAIVTPVAPQSVIADFGWLSQPELGKTRAVARGGFSAMLEEAGFGEKTRAVRKRSRDDAGGGISQVAVETVPPGSVSD